MGKEIKGNKEIVALVTTDASLVANGKAAMFICKNEEEQKTITREVALAMRGDVARLSNGVFLIVAAD